MFRCVNDWVEISVYQTRMRKGVQCFSLLRLLSSAAWKPLQLHSSPCYTQIPQRYTGCPWYQLCWQLLAKYYVCITQHQLRNKYLPIVSSWQTERVGCNVFQLCSVSLPLCRSEGLDERHATSSTHQSDQYGQDGRPAGRIGPEKWREQADCPVWGSAVWSLRLIFNIYSVYLHAYVY